MSTNPSVIAKLIATNVRARRKQLRMSQESMADKANIDRTYASQIERGIANPSLSVLCSVAKALDLSFIQLVSNDCQYSDDNIRTQ